jgi:hypothetical protein
MAAVNLLSLADVVNDRGMTSPPEVFSYLSGLIETIGPADCVSGRYTTQPSKGTKQSAYSDAVSTTLYVPFIINDDDTITKMVIITKGFTGKYEFALLNCATGIPVYAVSNIALVGEYWTGQMSIRYDRTRDSLAVYNDPKVNSGNSLLLLGNALARLFRVDRITIGDKATVPCLLGGASTVYLTALKRLVGQAGFYEKVGYVVPADAVKGINVIRDIPLSRFLASTNPTALSTVERIWSDFLQQPLSNFIVFYLEQWKNQPKEICDVITAITTSISENRSCKDAELCEILSTINTNLARQYKVVTEQDLGFLEVR